MFDIDNQVPHLLGPANQDSIGLQRASYVKLASVAMGTIPEERLCSQWGRHVERHSPYCPSDIQP
jgi:hypothetical protein